MSRALKRFTETPTPQTEQEDPRQVKSAGGGFTFQVNDQVRLERFLILGTDGGTYYVGERDLTKLNLDFLKRRIDADGLSVIETALRISDEGRAFRNSGAIFTLAFALAHGNLQTKARVQEIFSRIVRTSTHLFEFAQYVENLGGWGRAKRGAVENWYADKRLRGTLAYQVVKYRQRDGWTHADTLRLSHAPVDDAIARFVKRWYKNEQNVFQETGPEIIAAFEEVQAAQNVRRVLEVLDAHHDLPWEALPTQFLKEADVWKKLFYNGQLSGQALVRNITRLARIGAFNDMAFTKDYAEALVDPEMIRRTRLHPINYLNALVVHQEGQLERPKNKDHYWFFGINRKKDWTTVPQIVDALNNGFHAAFASVEPANKRTLIAVDVSSSMSSAAANGLDLSAAKVAAAEAMFIARTEPMYQVMGFAHTFRDLGIAPSMSLTEVLSRTERQNFGSTDCALPMTYAIQNKLEVDTFVILTDSETNTNSMHPHKALQRYRQQSGIPARLVVVGISATDVTIADPTDVGMLDLVGIDSNGPKILTEFSAGRI